MKKEENSSNELSPLQRSVVVIEKLKAKLKKQEYSMTEPIAIIGMGCRFPGEANDPRQFWQLLSNGIDAITEVPERGWDIDKYYDPDPETPGKMYTCLGGFIEQVEQFDPQFFRISPREALSIDPQHRLLLEVSWEAFEYAGIIPERLNSSSIGVFVGITINEYGKIGQHLSNTNLDNYAITGLPLNVAAGRIAYTFGLTGPCMSIDTACSSSLVAIHQACQSLRQKECKMALAGGVNLILLPDSMILTSKAKMLSVDGRCKTFDATADGMSRGEGCGMLLLKCLSDAQADGDNILAVIRGSAINHDGPSSGLTVPNGFSQEKVIRQALKMAKLEPSDISYIEAHGTGTPLGDPIELRSLARVFGKDDSREQPLNVGSVKTNLSHLETAAGVSGLIKTVLQLQHQQIVPHLHLKNPTTEFNWEDTPLVVPTELTSWEVKKGSRIAGINSFGASGTNAHIILEEAPTQIKGNTPQDSQERPCHIFTLSGKTATALEELASRYKNHLEEYPELELADICYTANTGRGHFDYRLAAIASNQQELLQKLSNFGTKEEVAGLFEGVLSNNTSSPKIAFLFTGQGSQYLNMGQQLYQQAPVFRQAIDECDQILISILEYSLLSIIYPKDEKDSSLLDQTSYLQPALFAIEYALVQLWQSWGIKPHVVMGHSVGEYVAATVAGVFSLEDGLRIIATRGQLMQQLSSGGEMVAVMASEEQVQLLINKLGLANYVVSIAAINGPESVVISGKSEVIKTLCNSLESQEIKTKQLQVSHAFHSPLMEPMLAEFELVANQLTYNQPQIQIISNVTGQKADKSISSAQYWVTHIRQPVRFAQGMNSLLSNGYEVFLEIGPKPILLGMGRQCIKEDVGLWLASMRPGVDEWQQMLLSLGQLYVRGVKPDWSGFDGDYTRQKIVLPTYPFQRQSYWIETTTDQLQNNSLGVSNNKTTQIVDLLNQGNTKKIAQELEKVGELSPTEIEILPKILELLVNQHQEQLDISSLSDWLYELKWHFQGRFGNQLDAKCLLRPAQIEQEVNKNLTELISVENLEVYEKILTYLEELSVEYVIQAFKQMGWVYEIGDSFSTDSIAKNLGIIPTHKRLLNRLLEILAEEGFLDSTSEEWRVLKILDEVNPGLKNQSLLSQYPQAQAELTLGHRCAESLGNVMRGALNPVEVLFPSGDFTTAAQLYAESPTAKVMNALVEQSVIKALEQLPPDRGVRFLEIGAGTGSTASYVLPHLPSHQTQYMFSDIGSLFIAKAQEKFQDYSFVSYQTLDIEVEPTSQGLKEGQFDVIIAANVLHATTRMSETMANVRKLLAPGGILVLLEGTTRYRWIDLIFGLLEGWWKYEDLELRPNHSLLTRPKWKQLLSETGFSEVVCLPDTSKVPKVLSEQAVIVATTAEIETDSTTPSKDWLIFADKEGVAENLATQLRCQGDVCKLVWAAEEYRQLAPEEFTINPNNPEDFEQLVAQIRIDSSNFHGVVQCWTMESGVAINLSGEELERLSQLGTGSTLFLVQALVKMELSQLPRLWLVTQGAQSVTNNYPLAGVAQSSIWGIGKVINLEHSELNCVRIDLEPEQSLETKALRLCSEIWSEDIEDQVVLRENSRYVPRLVRSDLTKVKIPVKFQADRSYMITGGLGGLGLLVSRWMIEQGAKHLVLVGRRPPDDAATEKLTELEQMGARVVFELADVSEWQSMVRLFSNINNSVPPLAGVIHAAGVLSDGVLKNQTWSSFEKVMKPKVQGAWYLHQLTKTQSLDFFVMFSSIASLFGSAGQGNHSTANAFMDALAYHRQSMGLPGLSIHWGAISQVGAAAEIGADTMVKLRGMGAINPTQVLEALNLLMGNLAVEVGVVPIDWPAWQEQAAKWMFLRDWKEPVETLSVSKINFLEQLKEALPSQKYSLLTTHVCRQVSQVLGMSSENLISLKAGFFDLGMDSLTSIELRNKLQNSLDCSISSTLTFDYPTVGELVDYLAEEVLKIKDSQSLVNETKESEDSKKQEELIDKTKELSEEQLEDLINQKLNLFINE